MSTESTTQESTATAKLPPLEQVLQAVGRHFQELSAYARYWLELQWDQWKLRIVGYVVLVLVGLGGLLTLALVLAAAAVLLVLGSAQLLGEHLYGGSLALGYVTVGGAILLLLPLALWCGGRFVERLLAAQLAAKYARKRELQRAKYGHDVEQRAAAPVAAS